MVGGKPFQEPPSKEEGNRQSACKPGSVWLRLPGTWQPFIWDSVCTLPLATHPDDWPGNRLEQVALPASSLFGLAPGGVYRAVPVTRSAVGSYPTLSPLPAHARAVYFLWHFP